MITILSNLSYMANMYNNNHNDDMYTYDNDKMITIVTTTTNNHDGNRTTPARATACSPLKQDIDQQVKGFLEL